MTEIFEEFVDVMQIRRKWKELNISEITKKLKFDYKMRNEAKLS